MKCNKGFSLLEVMISIAILSFISITTYEVVKGTFERKTVLEEFEEINHSTRVFFNLFKRDTELSFNYIPTDLQKKIKPVEGVKKVRTVFLGKDNEMHFTTLSHRRFGQDNHEIAQAEISYFLLKDEENDYNNLVRREQSPIDDEPFKGGSISEVVEAVKSVKFRYFSQENNNWVDYWDSEDPSPQFKGRFPFAVEVVLEVDVSMTEGEESLQKVSNIFLLESSNYAQTKY